MPEDTSPGPNDTIILVISTIVWGLSFPAIKVSLEEVMPLTLGLMRMLFGAVPLVIFLSLTRSRQKIVSTIKSGYLPIIGIALTQFYLPLTAQNVGMNMMDPESAASLSSILQATSPIFAIFFSSMFLKEYIGMKKAVGTALGLSGTILLVTQGGMVFSGSNFMGNLLLLSTAVIYAYSGVIAKRVLSKMEPIMVITLSMVLAVILFLPTSIAFEPVSHITDVSITTWSLVLYLGLVCNGIAMIMWYLVLTTNQLSKQVLFTYLIPLFGVIFSNLFIGEVITIQTIIFGVITIAGITIAQYGRKNSKPN